MNKVYPHLPLTLVVTLLVSYLVSGDKGLAWLLAIAILGLFGQLYVDHGDKVLAQKLEATKAQAKLTEDTAIDAMTKAIAELHIELESVKSTIAETSKTAEEAKKLGSQANLAVGFTPNRKPRA